MKQNFFKGYTFILALIYATIFCISIIVILGFHYHFVFEFRIQQIDERINEDLVELVDKVSWGNQFNVNRLALLIEDRVQSQMPTSTSIFLLADGSNGDHIAGNLSRMPEANFSETGTFEFQLIGFGPRGKDSHPVRAQAVRLPGEFILLVGRDINDLDALKKNFAGLLLFSIILTLALATLGAFIFSKVVSRRLKRINTTCNLVMEGDLSQRIAIRGSADGFDKLAVNFNEMMDRIETLMESISRVSDNIAHDLKTPLTRLRNWLELARKSNDDNPGDVQQTQQLIEQAIEEADSLLTTFSALLRIAHLESHASKKTFSNFYPQQLLEDVVQLYEPIAENKKIKVEKFFQLGDRKIFADRDLFFQALTNLMDNAVKYTPNEGYIQVSGINHLTGFEFVISDNGPGIPAEFYSKVQERFFRMESSRTTSGNGLGLNLVAVIAQLHGAELKFEANEPGLKVRLGKFEYAAK